MSVIFFTFWLTALIVGIFKYCTGLKRFYVFGLTSWDLFTLYLTKRPNARQFKYLAHKKNIVRLDQQIVASIYTEIHRRIDTDNNNDLPIVQRISELECSRKQTAQIINYFNRQGYSIRADHDGSAWTFTIFT